MKLEAVLDNLHAKITGNKQGRPAHPLGHRPACDNAIPAVDYPKEMNESDDDKNDSANDAI